MTCCHGVLFLEEDGALVGISSLFPPHWPGTRQELGQETHLKALGMETGACGNNSSTVLTLHRTEVKVKKSRLKITMNSRNTTLKWCLEWLITEFMFSDER